MLATVTRDSLRLWRPSAPTPPTSASSTAPAAAVANANSTAEFALAAALGSQNALAVPNDSIKHISWGCYDPTLLCATTARSHEILLFHTQGTTSKTSAAAMSLVDRISPLGSTFDSDQQEHDQEEEQAGIVGAHLLGPTNRLLLYATTSARTSALNLIHVFDRDTRELQESYAPLPSSPAGSPCPCITTLAFSHNSPTHSFFAVGTSSGDVYLIDRSQGTGDSLALASPFTGAITALAFSPASPTLLTAGDAHGTVAYWNLAPTTAAPDHDPRQPMATFQSAHTGPVTGICPSPINKIALISCGRDGTVVLYDSANAKRIRSFSYAAKYARQGFTCASFKNDGYSIALGVKGTGEVLVLDLRRPTVPVGVVGAGAGGEDVVAVGYAGPAHVPKPDKSSASSKATKAAYDKLVGNTPAGVAASVRTGRMPVAPGTVANPSTSEQQSPLPRNAATSGVSKGRLTLDAAAFSPVRGTHHQHHYTSSPTGPRPRPLSLSSPRASASSPIKSPTGAVNENESPLDAYTRQQRNSVSSPSQRHTSATTMAAEAPCSPSRARQSPTRSTTYHDPRAGVANAHVYAMHPDDLDDGPNMASVALDQDAMDVDRATDSRGPLVSAVHSLPPSHAGRTLPPRPVSPPAAGPQPSFSLALLHSAIDDALAGLRDQLRTDIQNVHLELLRQFDEHRVEMAELVVQVAGVQELVAENRRLRAEVERLRGGIPTAAAGATVERGGTGRWSTMGEGGIGSGASMRWGGAGGGVE